MPTGYTAPVQSGEITEFRDFAMNCARAFGALILMRDDPQNAKIPESFEPSDYHEKSIETAKSELAELESMTIEELDQKALSEYRKRCKDDKEARRKKSEHRERYERMLEMVRSYTPPTPDHVEFKSFMEKQLIESIDFDCGTSYYDKNPPVLLSGIEYKVQRKTDLERSISHHEEEHQEEIERTNSRNEWIKSLRQSLLAHVE